MTRRAIVPAELQSYYDGWMMSPGLSSGDFVFLTGFTGVSPDGDLPADAEQQIRNAFYKVELVLREAELDFSAIVEMTTYHVGLRDHFDVFKNVRSEFVQEPYPAWTAIEVAGFVHEDAIVEIKVIASREK
ncbi:RidA family protein [uncultured Roseibium sp.]|uniref:RidA family protein n=1 Tax=uncultured Roseibium sp. TaxID=1936171 RepID=UPI002623482E|nr:RidA family protein [uncultured Roseibium sp.]